MKKAILVLALSDLLIFGGWFLLWSRVPVESRSLFWQEKYYVEVVQKDDFGDMVKRQVEVKRFVPGLIDNALPASGLVTAAVVVWLIRNRLRAR